MISLPPLPSLYLFDSMAVCFLLSLLWSKTVPVQEVANIHSEAVYHGWRVLYASIAEVEVIKSGIVMTGKPQIFMRACTCTSHDLPTHSANVEGYVES